MVAILGVLDLFLGRRAGGCGVGGGLSPPGVGLLSGDDDDAGDEAAAARAANERRAGRCC